MNLSLRSLFRRAPAARALALALTAMPMLDAHADGTAIDPASITCRLAIAETLAAGQPASLSLTLVNQGKVTLHILKRNTPLEGWLADSLAVTRDGQPLSYTGPMAKRAPPSRAEYLRLGPGKSLQHKIAVDPAYDVAAPGNYRLRWRGELMDVRTTLGNATPENLAPLQLSCPEVAFTRQR